MATKCESIFTVHITFLPGDKMPTEEKAGRHKLKNSQPNEEVVASKLKGNTLRVYWHLLRSNQDTLGPREIQRELGFSSPALAVYHLKKLVTLGLVEKKLGEYRLVREVDVGVLKQFIKLGSLILPRHVLYATLFTTLLVFYVTQMRIINFYSLYALILGTLATGILWYETIRVWQQKP
jgi:hypothetical protein